MEQLSNLDRFLRARREHTLAKRQASESYAAMRAIERQLVEEMQEKDMRAVTTGDGTKVHLRRYETCSVTKENEGQLRMWLRELHGDDHAFEVAMLAKPAVTDWIKKQLEAGAFSEIDLPDFLDYKTGLGAVVSEVSF